jgi:hypothetical protein
MRITLRLKPSVTLKYRKADVDINAVDGGGLRAEEHRRASVKAVEALAGAVIFLSGSGTARVLLT